MLDALEQSFAYLNENAGALTVIFTAIVTLSTVVYAVLTAVLVRETRQMREAQTEPKVEVVIRPREEWIGLFYIVTRNIGLGPAYDLAFEIKIEAGGEGAQALIDDFTKTQFFERGLRYLGPGQEAVSGYSQMNQQYKEKIQSVLLFNIRYKSATGKHYKEQYRVDFREFEGMSQHRAPHLYNISKNIEKIQKDLQKLVSGFSRLRVEVYDKDDREQERLEMEERFREFAKNKNEKDIVGEE